MINIETELDGIIKYNIYIWILKYIEYASAEDFTVHIFKNQINF